MSATRTDNPATPSTLSGNEIFEQALTLSTQGIELLLKNFFEQIDEVKFHHLSSKDSKRLVAQVRRKQELILSSYLFQIKNNFADFRALRKNRLYESTSTNHDLLGLVGTNEYTETEQLDSMISRFEKQYDQYYLPIAEQLGNCIDRPQVESFDNPMHVKHLCQSFQRSISSLSLVIAQKIALYKLFSDSVIDRLDPLYSSLEQYFFEHNIDSEVLVAPEESPDRALNIQSATDKPAEPTHDLAMTDVLRHFYDKSNGGLTYTDHYAGLRQIFEQHHIKVFHPLIDRLSTIFELVFADEDLADHIKEQIGRLQILVFMSEAQQSGFPNHSGHPARRLIDTIVRTEVDFEMMGLSNRSGYDFLRDALDKLGRSPSPLLKTHIFTELLEQYIEQTSAKLPMQTAFNTETDAQPDDSAKNNAEGESEEPSDGIDTKEESVAEEVIEISAASVPEPGSGPESEIIEEIELSGEDTVIASKKVESIYAVIQSVVDDMTLPLRIQGRSVILFDEVWSPLLLEVATTQGFKSPAWQKLMTIARSQVWVLTPKADQVELDKLMSMLAHIETSLTQSMRSLSIPLDHQLSLLEFQEHEQADVINQSKAIIEENKLAEQTEVEPAIEGSEAIIDTVQPKEEQVNTIDEFSNLMETGRFGQSKDMLIALKSDKSTTETNVPLSAENIHKSDWVEIKQGDSTLLAKLTWKAEDLSHYIFVDRDGNRVCEISREDLDKELKAENISLISSTGISSRRSALRIFHTIN